MKIAHVVVGFRGFEFLNVYIDKINWFVYICIYVRKNRSHFLLTIIRAVLDSRFLIKVIIIS